MIHTHERHETAAAAANAARRAADAAGLAGQRDHLLIDTIPHVVWMADPDGRIVHVNERAAERLGIRLADAQGWNWTQFMHPDDEEQVRRTWGAALESGNDYVCEYRLRHPDGEFRWYLARAAALRRANGHVERWVGTLTDVNDLRRAKEALAHDALLLREVRDSIIVTDCEGIITHWNDGAGQVFGETAEEMLGRPLADRYPVEARERVVDLRTRVLAGRGWQGEFEDYRKDGSRVWIDARVSPTTDAAGRPTGILFVCHEVTARKAAEAERDQAHAQLRLQIDRMPLGYLLLDAEFRVTDCNAAAERIFGYAKEELVGMRPPFDKLVPVSARQPTHGLLQRIRSSDMTASLCNDNLTKDGRIITCQWSNTPLFDATGRFLGLMSLAEDITERKRGEDALRASEERFRQIAESIQEVFWLAAADEQEPAYVSPAYEVIWGRSRESLYASPASWLNAVHPDDRQRVAEAAGAKKALGEYEEEYRIVRPDGTIRWIRDRAFPVRGEHGEIVRVAGVAEDVTERRQLERHLQQARKMEAVGQLAGGVAHDFNNLLTIINGYSELLLDSPDQTAASRELILEIHKAGERSAALTSQLLAFSRRQVLAPRVIDVNEIVRDLDKMLGRVIGEDIRLTTTLEEGLGSVKADPGQFQETLLNLAVNARDAMPQGGALTIETRTVELDQVYFADQARVGTGPHVVLAFADTGEGMSEDVKRHIFEPFFTTKAPGSGTGLGLAVVHGFVQQSSGHIEVYSEPGLGTCFKIYLPIVGAAPASDQTAGSTTSQLPCGTETILLVEDQDGVRAFTRRVLEGCGYTVLDAACGDDALRIAGRQGVAIHLLVTDVVMPGMGGRSLAEQLVALHPEARVLYMSGYTSDAVVRHGIAHEHVNFIQKPFSAMLIAQRIRELLAF